MYASSTLHSLSAWQIAKELNAVEGFLEVYLAYPKLLFGVPQRFNQDCTRYEVFVAWETFYKTNLVN